MRRSLQYLLGRVNWGVVSALVVSLSVYAVACASAQTIPASTGCIGNPGKDTTIFRPGLDPVSKGQLAAHEAVHRAQIEEGMKTGLDCYSAFWRLTSSADSNLYFEVPAYRAQADWLAGAVGPGFHEDRFYEYTAGRLYFAYRKTIPYLFILGYLQTGKPPKGQLPAVNPPPIIENGEEEIWKASKR